MRFLVKVEFSVEAGNAKARDGSLGTTIQAILEDQKPEAAYFLLSNGKRTGFLIVDLQDPSQISAIAEPWLLAFDASIEFDPVMTVEDLGRAGEYIEQSAKKYG